MLNLISKQHAKYAKICPFRGSVSYKQYLSLFQEFKLRRKLKNTVWKNPAVMDEFRLKLENSSMVHVCEKKSSGETQVCLPLYFL